MTLLTLESPSKLARHSERSAAYRGAPALPPRARTHPRPEARVPQFMRVSRSPDSGCANPQNRLQSRELHN